jgi:hypothetical protein
VADPATVMAQWLRGSRCVPREGRPVQSDQ